MTGEKMLQQVTVRLPDETLEKIKRHQRERERDEGTPLSLSVVVRDILTERFADQPEPEPQG